jgi:WS/DGAT/MGAT family acyltransferase
VDGLPNGRFAVLVVVHHILADGLAGMRLLAALLDTDPDAVRDDPPVHTPPPLPTHRELMRDNLRARLSRDRHSRTTARSAGGSRRAMAQLREAMSNFSEPLPRTSLPRLVGPSRRMSVTSADLDALRALGHDSGATVNDLLLAAVTNGLRDLLIARGECRESLSVRTVIPVARDDSEQAASMMVVNLPVGQPDPQRRLETIVEQTTARKADLKAAGDTAGDLRALPVPIARLVIPWARRRGSARIHLSVTNVPGPADPLWFSGAQLIEAIPVPPLVPLVGLTVAALSYAGRLGVAVNADGAVKDLDTMGAGIATSLTQRPPHGRSRPHHTHRT